MDWSQRVNRLEFDHKDIADQQVEAMLAHRMALVVDLALILSDKRNSAQSELDAYCLPI